jgi:hypothetical protein
MPLICFPDQENKLRQSNTTGKSPNRCQAFLSNRCGLLRSAFGGDLRVKPTGWAEFEVSKSPLLLSYVWADGNRPDLFTGMACDHFNLCGSDKCVGADASIAFQFSANIVKEEDWRGFEMKVHELFDYLLVNQIN